MDHFKELDSHFIHSLHHSNLMVQYLLLVFVHIVSSPFDFGCVEFNKQFL